MDLIEALMVVGVLGVNWAFLYLTGNYEYGSESCSPQSTDGEYHQFMTKW